MGFISAELSSRDQHRNRRPLFELELVRVGQGEKRLQPVPIREHRGLFQ
jgi:hypothetical protein